MLESLNEQAENIRKSLTGLTEADIHLLAAKSSYERAEEMLEIWLSDVSTVGSVIDEMEGALSNLPTKSAPRAADLPEAAILAEIENATGDYIATVKTAAKEMKRQQSAFMSDDGLLKGTAGASVKKWRKALDAFNQKYADAKGRASVHQSRLEQLGQVEKRIGELRSTIARTRREMTGLANRRRSMSKSAKPGFEQRRSALGLSSKNARNSQPDRRARFAPAFA